MSIAFPLPLYVCFRSLKTLKTYIELININEHHVDLPVILKYLLSSGYGTMVFDVFFFSTDPRMSLLELHSVWANLGKCISGRQDFIDAKEMVKLASSAKKHRQGEVQLININEFRCRK